MDLKLIGREKESGKINELISLTGQNNNLFILVSGETGIGKTSLIDKCLKSSGIKFYTNRSFEEAAPAYSSLSSIFRSFIRESKIKEINFGPLTKYLNILLPEISSHILETDKVTLADAVCDALFKIAHDDTLIIFLDDIQWIDNATLELLPLLIDRLNNFPVTFLAAYIEDELNKDLKIKRFRHKLRRSKKFVEINLSPFGIKETEELIGYLFKNIPSDSLVKLIFEKSHGIPFYIIEFIESLKENNLTEIKSGKIILKQNSAIPLSENIRDAILFKLNNISEKSLELLEIAAVAGQEFELSIFKDITGKDQDISELLGKNIIKESVNGRAEFKHVLIRDTVRDEISWNKKRELNTKIARLFEEKNYEAETIAYHWQEANEFEKARQALLESAKRSCNIQAYSDAADATVKALKIWPEGEEEIKKLDTMLQLAYCRQLNGELTKSIKILLETIENANKIEDYKIVGKANRDLSTIYGVQGNWELFIQSKIDAATAFEKANLFDDSASEYLTAASKSTGMIKLDNAIVLTSKAIELSDKTNNFEIKAKSLGLKGNVLSMTGNYSKGRETVQKALELALENNLNEAASEIYRRLASTMEYASDYTSAKEAYYSAYNFCVSTGSDVSAQICLSCMSYVLFQTGEWKKSLQISDDVVKNTKSPEGSRSTALIMKALIHALRGEIKSSEKYLSKSYKLILLSSNSIIFLFYYWCCAIINELNNDNEQMILNYKNVIKSWQKSQDRHDVIIILIWAANNFCKQKMKKEVIKCTEALSLISTETSNPEALSGLAFTLGEFSNLNGNYEEAYKQIEQALSHQNKLNIPLEKMFMQTRLAEVLLKLNKKEKAAGYLQSAYSTAKIFAVRPYISRIASILGRLNDKTGKIKINTAIESEVSLRLTKRQNEILHLLSKGLTNKEIAEQVFLSCRTVDMHVSNILERLNSRTRTEAITKAKEMQLI